MSGWIKLHRSTTEWEWYSDHNTTRLFIHLLINGIRLFRIRLKDPGPVSAAGILLIPFTRNDGGHDLTGPGPNGGESQIPEYTFNGEDIGIPDPAHDLHGIVGHLLAGFCDEFFGSLSC